MKIQFASYPVSTAMVLGIAGGNGLKYVAPQKYKMEEKSLIRAMNEISYELLKTDEYPLASGKKLIMLDFKR